MPLGFAPLTSGPTGASPLSTAITTTTVGGVAVALVGMEATSALGTATDGLTARTALTGVAAIASLGTFSMTVGNVVSQFLIGLEATASLGEAIPAATVTVEVEGVSATAVQGGIAYISVGSAVLEGIYSTGALGTATVVIPERWVEIEPVTVPGWTVVTTLN